MTSVKSARQVIDALNAEGPDIDIILAEIDLPMAKGMKMLRYITRDKDLRRIPVISKLCSLLFLILFIIQSWSSRESYSAYQRYFDSMIISFMLTNLIIFSI